MYHEITQTSFGLKLRPIRMEDAEFILELRCNPSLNRFVGDTSPDLESQKNWLKEYFQRADDYYFCMELGQSGKPVGTIGIYHAEVQDGIKTAEWGRWLISTGVLAAPASIYLIYQIAFERLALDQISCRTVLENSKVLSFHDRSGAERCGIKKNDVILRGQPRDQVVHRVTRSLWGSVESNLAYFAGLTERFLESS
jgi:RimJ/RimL family protein N-acetyltransferase